MATVICPNCGATNLIVSQSECECEYCGSMLNDSSYVKSSLPKEDTDTIEIIRTGTLKISENDAIKIAKDTVNRYLKDILKDEDEEVYKYFLSPLTKKFEELQFAAKLYYVPIYLYKGEGIEDNNVVDYNFSCFAGDEHSFPKCIIDTVNFNTCFNVSYCKDIKLEATEDNKLNQTHIPLFVKNSNEIWHSVRARKMRNYLRDYDAPLITSVVLPIFLVAIKLGRLTKDMAISGEGKIWRDTSYYEDLFAERELGTNYQNIIDDLKAFDGKELAREINKLRNK